MIPSPVKPVRLKQKEGHKLYGKWGLYFLHTILVFKSKFDFKTKPRCAIWLYYTSI